MKLYFKFFIPVTVILIIALLIISGLFMSSSYNALIESSHEQLNKNIYTVEASLNVFIEDFFSFGKILASDDHLEDFMFNYDLTNTEAVDYTFNKLNETLAASNHLNNVLLMTPTGEIQLDAKRVTWENPKVFSDGFVVTTFKDNPTLDSIIIPPKIAPSNNKPIFDLALRIKNEDQYVGNLILAINVEHLMDELIYKNLHDSETVVLISDSQGKIYGSQNKDYVYNEDYYISNIDESLYNKMTTNKSGIIEQDFLGQPSSIFYQYYEPLNSYIIAVKDLSERSSLQLNVIITTSIITIIIIFISGLGLLHFIKYLVKPIDNLADNARLLTDGSYNFNVNNFDMDRSDELGELTRAFHSMTLDIKSSFEQLDHSKSQLLNQLNTVNKQKEYINFIDNYDALTRLPNREHFFNHINEILSHKNEGALMLLDLDNFRSINDTLGHIFGDNILLKTSEILQKMSCDNVYISRMGGDEFAILVNSSDMVSDIIKEIKDSFNQTFLIDNTSVKISFSIGISLFPSDSISSGELLSYAEIALYNVKNNGKNGYHFFNTDMNEKVHLRRSIETALKEAADNDGFIMNYQPQVNLQTGKIIAYEALIRLKSASFSPGDFIPVAESTGQIIGIGRWVTTEVIRQIGQWQRDGYPVKPISINFSAYQLYDADYFNILTNALKTHHVDPSLLEIEITESIYFKNIEMTSQFLNKLDAMGLKISIDDFGTGYSSLNYLTYMPLSKLKIDSTLSNKFLDSSNSAVIESIISLSHSLNLIVVAEGIEDIEHIKKLRDAKCDIVQGYYYSKPLIPEAVIDSFSTIYPIS